MAGELLSLRANVQMTHVPYKGSGPAMADLVGGQVQIGFSSITAALPFIREGRLRPLATTGAKRSAALPDVPTVIEAGYPGFESSQWLGLLAPRGTPREIIGKLHDETVKALKLPDVSERLVKAGLQPVGNTSEEFTNVIRTEIEQFGKLAKELGIEPQ